MQTIEDLPTIDRVLEFQNQIQNQKHHQANYLENNHPHIVCNEVHNHNSYSYSETQKKQQTTNKQTIGC
jgi:hypothetical protein